MKSTHATPPDESLMSELGISLGLHLVVGALVVFKVVLFPSEPLMLERSIRVDIVDLPNKLPAQQSVTPPRATPTTAEVVKPKSPPKPAEPQAPKVALPDKMKVDRKAQNAALERIKALQEIESQVQSEEKPKPAKPFVYKGQVLNPGTQLTGIDKLQHDNYLGDLDAHVKQSWVLPQWLKNSDLKARVLVQIDAQGNILKRTLTKSSNNPMYDEKVLEAIDRAAPFPKPPDKFVRILEVSGVEFGFPE